jgi:hypothetical protein
MPMRQSSLIQILRTGGRRGSSSGKSRAIASAICRFVGQTKTGAHLGSGEEGSARSLTDGMSSYQVDEGPYPLCPPRPLTPVVLEHNHVGTIEGDKLTNFLEALKVLLSATCGFHAPIDERVRPFENGVAEAPFGLGP